MFPIIRGISRVVQTIMYIMESESVDALNSRSSYLLTTDRTECKEQQKAVILLRKFNIYN